MITVYDIGNENYLANGNVILTPTACKIKQIAGGQYDLTMTHPIDANGKWEHLVPEAIIKAPIPEETIESAVSGMDADVYVVTASTGPLYENPQAQTPIYYSAWNYQTEYHVGDKVRCANWSHKNYQCTQFDSASGLVQVAPYNNPAWWTPIADYTPIPALVTLNQGDEVYLIEVTSESWYHVTTIYGLEGYMQSSVITYDHHLTPAETGPQLIRDQLFRIKSAAVDTKAGTVTVTAEHVSYDLKGVLVAGVDLSQQTPAMALAWIQSGFMMAYRGTIATNMTDDDDGTYTGQINGKNAIYALLDPDQGVVAKFDAECRRNNWDLYVMRKTEVDRGFRLRYRKNVLGVNWSRKSDQLITRVVPVAKDEKGRDFFLDNDGVQWVDSEDIDDYPVIRMEWLKVQGQVGKDDGTQTATNWTEETLRAEMETKATERFTIDKADQIVHEITVDFEMLGDTAEYAALKNLEQVLLYDQVIVTDERIGLDVTVTVNELEYDCIREKVTALKLSNVSERTARSVSGFSVVNRSITGVKLTDDAGVGIVSQAVDESTEYSKQYTNDKTSALNISLRSWVSNNFVPIS